MSKEELKVYAWGCAFDGRLGIKVNDSRSAYFQEPIEIDWLNGSEVKFVSAGRRQSAVLNSQGKVIQIGEGAQYFDRSIEKQVVKFVACGNDMMVVGCENPDGSCTVMCRGCYQTQFTFTPTQNVLQVACGTNHVLVLTENAGVWSMGGNGSCQCGHATNGTPVSQFAPILSLRRHKIVQVSCGGYHSLVLADDGTVWAFGANDYGQCGQGTTGRPITSPTMVEALKDHKISFICAGTSHSVALSKNGKAWSWGRNHANQCSASTKLCIPSPVQLPGMDKEHLFYATAGFDFTICVALSGNLFIWGSVWQGQRYSGLTKFEAFKGRYVHQLWAGHYHVIALIGETPKFFFSSSTLAYDMQKLYSSSTSKDICLECQNNSIYCHSFVLQAFAPKLLEAVLANGIKRDDVYVLSLAQPFAIVEAAIKFFYHFSVEVPTTLLTQLTAFASMGGMVSLQRVLKIVKEGCDTSADTVWLRIPASEHALAFADMRPEYRAKFADIVIHVSDDSGEKEFLVNKTILSMRSDYFNAMFSSGMTEAQSNRISLKASPDAFEIVLRFIYTDECVFQGDTVVEVLALATAYLLQRLADEAEAFLVKNLSSENVLELLDISNTLGAAQLKRHCLHYVRKMHEDDYQQLPSFNSLSDEMKKLVEDQFK